MKNDVITYGFTNEQLSLLMEYMPDGYELTTAECVTDLIVTDAVCTVIVPQNMGEDAVRSLLAYYMDVGDRLDETVVWLGKVELPNLPSFVRCDDFLQLLINCKEIVARAKCRYDIMQQYTDIYSYLPKHAIAECLEADYYSALKQWLPNYPLKAARKQWMSVLKLENGAELLASICELCRWLQKENITFRMSHEARWQIFVLLFFMTEDGISYTSECEFDFCFCEEDYHKVKLWLQNHWYFRNPDNRLKIYPVNGLESGIASIDVQLMGMRPGEVILVGGRPAMGKTSFAKGVAEHVAKTKNVLFFDLEECGCVRNPNIHGLTGCFSIEQIYTVLEKEKPDLLIIDRFQRIPEIMDDGCHQTIMGAIKRMAHRFQIPVLVTTDLSRDVEERPCPAPFEKDIPAYRFISPYVDTVLLLYRPAYYDPDFDRGIARCIIEKAKRCDYKVLSLRWDDENYKFTD